MFFSFRVLVSKYRTQVIFYYCMSESLRGGPLYTDNKNIPGAAAIKLTKVKFLISKLFGIHQNIEAEKESQYKHSKLC